MREHLRSARKIKNLSQKELGQMVGLTYQAIGHLERGRMDTTSAKWRKLAKVLGSSIERLSLDDAASQ